MHITRVLYTFENDWNLHFQCIPADLTQVCGGYFSHNIDQFCMRMSHAFSRSEKKSFDAYSHELCCTWVLRLPFSAALYLLLNVRYWSMKYQQSFTIIYRFKALFSSLINLKRQLSSLPQFFTSFFTFTVPYLTVLFFKEGISCTEPGKEK